MNWTVVKQWLTMPMRYEANGGGTIPRGFGVAYAYDYKMTFVCYPVPINWIVGYAMKCWWFLMDSKVKQASRYQEGRVFGYTKGYQAGLIEGAKRGRDETLDTIDKVIKGVRHG